MSDHVAKLNARSDKTVTFWYEFLLQRALKMVPFTNVIKPVNVGHVKLKVRGDSVWNLPDLHLIDIAFVVHSSQMKLIEWEHATSMNKSVLDAATGNGNWEIVLERRYKHFKTNERAWQRCTDSDLVLIRDEL